jgi:pimeloyl-ACP methyl ester carboxylesterase
METSTLLRQLGEVRAPFELGAYFVAEPLLRQLKAGDGHPVLVLPGFTASDRSTEPLRRTIRSLGYWTYGWQLGANLGPSEYVVSGLKARLEHIWTIHRRPISLVGWSLGGIYARQLARLRPVVVRQVITLGSPFRVDGDALANALPVPSTAIYSRTDGIVRWQTCIDRVSERHENIEVHGSHTGLGFNPAVIYAVADRLALPIGQWNPFRAPITMRMMYPTPSTGGARQGAPAQGGGIRG